MRDSETRRRGIEQLADKMIRLPQPWTATMEATVFTGWIYDHLGRMPLR